LCGFAVKSCQTLQQFNGWLYKIRSKNLMDLKTRAFCCNNLDYEELLQQKRRFRTIKGRDGLAIRSVIENEPYKQEMCYNFQSKAVWINHL
jgi:hypothetical protein